MTSFVKKEILQTNESEDCEFKRIIKDSINFNSNTEKVTKQRTLEADTFYLNLKLTELRSVLTEIDISTLNQNEKVKEVSDIIAEVLGFRPPLLHIFDINPTKLSAVRKEELGVEIKQGVYSLKENSLIDRNIGEFMKNNKLSNRKLLLGIFTNRFRRKFKYLAEDNFFLFRLAKDLNNRPLYSVYKRARCILTQSPQNKNCRQDVDRSTESNKKGFESTRKPVSQDIDQCSKSFVAANVSSEKDIHIDVPVGKKHKDIKGIIESKKTVFESVQNPQSQNVSQCSKDFTLSNASLKEDIYVDVSIVKMEHDIPEVRSNKTFPCTAPSVSATETSRPPPPSKHVKRCFEFWQSGKFYTQKNKNYKRYRQALHRITESRKTDFENVQNPISHDANQCSEDLESSNAYSEKDIHIDLSIVKKEQVKKYKQAVNRIIELKKTVLGSIRNPVSQNVSQCNKDFVSSNVFNKKDTHIDVPIIKKERDKGYRQDVNSTIESKKDAFESMRNAVNENVDQVSSKKDVCNIVPVIKKERDLPEVIPEVQTRKCFPCNTESVSASGTSKPLPSKSAEQCYEFWLSSKSCLLKNCRSYKWSKIHDICLIFFMYSYMVPEERLADWDAAFSAFKYNVPYLKLRAHWCELKNIVPDCAQKEHEDIVLYLYHGILLCHLTKVDIKYSKLEHWLRDGKFPEEL